MKLKIYGRSLEKQKLKKNCIYMNVKNQGTYEKSN